VRAAERYTMLRNRAVPIQWNLSKTLPALRRAIRRIDRSRRELHKYSKNQSRLSRRRFPPTLPVISRRYGIAGRCIMSSLGDRTAAVAYGDND